MSQEQSGPQTGAPDLTVGPDGSGLEKNAVGNGDLRAAMTEARPCPRRLRRLFTTPVNRAVYLLGTLTGQLALALLQMLLLVGVGTLLLGLQWGSSPLRRRPTLRVAVTVRATAPLACPAGLRMSWQPTRSLPTAVRSSQPSLVAKRMSPCP